MVLAPTGAKSQSASSCIVWVFLGGVWKFFTTLEPVGAESQSPSPGINTAFCHSTLLIACAGTSFVSLGAESHSPSSWGIWTIFVALALAGVESQSLMESTQLVVQHYIVGKSYVSSDASWGVGAIIAMLE